jgi:hypothetical protein
MKDPSPRCARQAAKNCISEAAKKMTECKTCGLIVILEDGGNTGASLGACAICTEVAFANAKEMAQQQQAKAQEAVASGAARRRQQQEEALSSFIDRLSPEDTRPAPGPRIDCHVRGSVRSHPWSRGDVFRV